MTKITNENVLTIISNYYASIGLKAEADLFFTQKRFNAAVILKLPQVCVFPSNRPADSSTHQTHIHVTGQNMLLFFSESELNSNTSSSEDKNQGVVISQANINNLKYGNKIFDNIGHTNTYTFTKIAHRNNQSNQVQISKIQLDGVDFLNLRKALFEDDLLVFLKFAQRDILYAVGIPKSFYDGVYELEHNSVYINRPKSQGRKTDDLIEDVKTAISGVTLDSSDELIDLLYQEQINSVEIEDNINDAPYTPEEYHSDSQPSIVKSSRPKTNPKLGKQAIKANQYRCFFDDGDVKHQTFIKPNGEIYMEAHHIIPLQQQSIFKNKLDTRANIVALCPVCHKRIHYGAKKDVDDMLDALFSNRQSALSESGLTLSFEDLQSYY